MFKILGSDGKEYGPISGEQICQWLREGRAGAPTLAQRAGTTEWLPLSALPEFAAQLRRPDPVAGANELPYAVRLLARLMFVVAALSLILSLLSVAGIINAMSHGSYRPSLFHYFSWAVAFLAVPLRVVLGIGLGRGREWARQVAIYFSVVMAGFGAWGMSGTFRVLANTDAWAGILRSPMFLLSITFSLALFLFNVATILLLTRPTVRSAFQAKSAATV
jgi:hypothetical protein